MKHPLGSLRTASALLVLFFVASATAQTAPAPGITIKTLSGEAHHLTSSDFKNRIDVKVTDHDGKSHDFEGVALSEVLADNGAPMGKDLRGKELADYVLLEASDGYRVTFALADIDPDLGGTQAIIADKVDGAPLSAHDGPYRLIVPADKRPARWIRMLTSITIARPQ